MKYLKYFESKNYINEMLIKAVGANDYDDVVYFVKKGADVHYKNDLALLRSIKYHKKNSRIFDFLIENGADIHNTKNGEILVYATKYNDLSLLKYLIENGVERDESSLELTKNWKGECSSNHVMMNAMTYGSLPLIKYLEKQGYWDDNITKHYLWQPIKKNKLAVVKYIIEKDPFIIEEKHLVYSLEESQYNCKNLTIPRLLEKYVKLSPDGLKEVMDNLHFSNLVINCSIKIIEFLIELDPTKIEFIKSRVPDDVKKKYPRIFRSVNAGLWETEKYNINSRKEFIRKLTELEKEIDEAGKEEKYYLSQIIKNLEYLIIYGIQVEHFTADEINKMRAQNLKKMARKKGIVELFKNKKFELLKKLINDGLYLDDQLSIKDSFFYRNIAKEFYILGSLETYKRTDDDIVEFIADIDPAYVKYIPGLSDNMKRKYGRTINIGLWDLKK